MNKDEFSTLLKINLGNPLTEKPTNTNSYTVTELINKKRNSGREEEFLNDFLELYDLVLLV